MALNNQQVRDILGQIEIQFTGLFGALSRIKEVNDAFAERVAFLDGFEKQKDQLNIDLTALKQEKAGLQKAIAGFQGDFTAAQKDNGVKRKALDDSLLFIVAKVKKAEQDAALDLEILQDEFNKKKTEVDQQQKKLDGLKADYEAFKKAHGL